jgi:hypothetical protein
MSSVSETLALAPLSGERRLPPGPKLALLQSVRLCFDLVGTPASVDGAKCPFHRLFGAR